MSMRKIKKGDLVQVITGKNKGKKATVLAIAKGGKKLLLDGVNTAKKHVKANPQTGEQGSITMKNMLLDYSNVMLLNQTSDKVERVGIRILPGDKKVRYFKSTNTNVD